MHSVHRWVTVAVVLVATGLVSADTGDTIRKVSEAADGSLVMVSFKLKVDSQDEPRTVGGPAFCISADNRVFMTMSIPGDARAEDLSDFQAIVPGKEGKRLKAKFLGLEPSTGLAFVQVTEDHKFQEVQFAVNSDLEVGTQVVSTGMMPGDPAHTPYHGVAYVSARIRAPEELVYVTGGTLTHPGSPVFNADGKAVGLVGRQLFMAYQTQNQRGGASTVPLRGDAKTNFFIPVEEFKHVMESIPTDGSIRRAPWYGINRLQAVTDEMAELYKGLELPAVRAYEIFPNSPAAKSGLKEGDIIVEVDGKRIEELASESLVVMNLRRKLSRQKIGEEVKLGVFRDGKVEPVTLKPVAMPTRPNEAKRHFERSLGFVAREKVVFDKYSASEAVAKTDGLIVLFVARQSPAALDGLRPGDVIKAVNSVPVDSTSTLEKILDEHRKNNPAGGIKVTVQRREGEESLTITPRSR